MKVRRVLSDESWDEESSTTEQHSENQTITTTQTSETSNNIINQIRSIIENKDEPGGIIPVIGMDSKEVAEQAIYNYAAGWQVMASIHHHSDISSEILSTMLNYHKERNYRKISERNYGWSAAEMSFNNISNQIIEACSDVNYHNNLHRDYMDASVTLEGISKFQQAGEKIQQIWQRLWNFTTENFYSEGKKFVIQIEISPDEFTRQFFEELSRMVNPEYVAVIVTCKETCKYNDLQICQMDAETWTPTDFYGHFCNGRVFYTETEDRHRHTGIYDIDHFYDDDYDDYDDDDEEDKGYDDKGSSEEQSSSRTDIEPKEKHIRRFDGIIRSNPLKGKK